MILRKKTVQDFANAPDELLAVLLEPLPGYSDREVVDMLTTKGAHEIEVLGPGFISAQIDRSTLKDAEAVAFVHPKRRKQLHQVQRAPRRRPAARR
jgi:hypothetical protein